MVQAAIDPDAGKFCGLLVKVVSVAKSKSEKRSMVLSRDLVESAFSMS